LTSPGYIATPETRAALKKIGYLNSGAAGVAVWSGDSCNGQAGFVTNALPKTNSRGTGTNLHAMVYGYFDALQICEWGVASIVLDSVTRKKQNMVECTVTGFYDLANLHPAAFIVTPDLAVS
jgi:hypothetical protein